MTNSPPIVSDATIDAAKNGNRDALGEIFRTYQPALLRYLRTRAEAMSEDIASQTWVSVAQSIHNFHGDGSALRGWIITIGRRRLIDEFRRSGRRPESPLEIPDIIDESTPEDIVMSSADWALNLISRLPPHQADVVLLRVIGGLSVAEVATETGHTPANVRVLSHRGLAKLQEFVADQDAMDEAAEIIAVSM